ncbi:type IV secretion system protein VirB2-8 [Anaplasma phagocytophilum]|uniref:Type IV secretion protein VirB2 homolog VirB2-8 n=1 Tax=Anaplasma phagocytophilum (strain HZ) TaxID=212042 RepID=Q2GIX9_ANAPZ|nr:type IV secretion system protein VirB2-8 [Anaplasma phagocytophilum]ABD43359.1 Type IV secretion protein VirB2 homolog VirB2-8 [Anaplasma phagocytophilum str. HZ]AGR79038.1 type VI secretion protein [Anaplasma phagocytophilum str. HZ2]
MFTNILRSCVISIIFFIFLILPAVSVSAAPVTHAAGDGEVISKVICNVVVFVQRLGLPIMTGVILGSSIMAVFGRLAWPAIVMLVVFTAIFFGAGKLISKFAGGISELGAEDFDCRVLAGKNI